MTRPIPSLWGYNEKLYYHKDISTTIAMVQISINPSQFAYAWLKESEIMWLKDLSDESRDILNEVNRGWGISESNLFALRLRILVRLARKKGYKNFEFDTNMVGMILSSEEAINYEYQKHLNNEPYTCKKIGAR